MAGATADRLKALESELHNKRQFLADVKTSSGSERHQEVIRDQIEQLQAEQVGLLEMIGKANGNGHHGGGWQIEKFDAVRERLETLATTASRFGTASLGEVASKAQLVGELGLYANKADVVAPTSSRTAPFAGAVAQPRRPLTLLDLIPSAPMDNNVLPYLVESGAWTAAEQTEGAAKVESTVTLTEAEAQAQTIAGWIKSQKQSIADFSGLQDLIATRLRYAVRRRLETQVLVGDGVAPNLRGITNTSGTLAVSFVASSTIPDMIARGIAAVTQAEGEPNGIVLNPADWLSAVLLKATGSGEYLSSGPFGMTEQTLWSIPVTLAPALPAGAALVGDFSKAATVLVREPVRVLVSDADGDDFTKNRVTILGEGRFALATWVPGLIAEVALA